MTAIEIGYGYTGKRLNAKINGYYTDWKDKSLLSRSFQDPVSGADTRSMIRGLSAVHQGIEHIKRDTREVSALLFYEFQNVIEFIFKHLKQGLILKPAPFE